MIDGLRIEGFAIVSRDGRIAGADAIMPTALQLDADRRYFEAALDGFDVVVHGRRSHEGHPNSARRRRLVLTRAVAAVGPVPEDANARLWNPQGAPLGEACAALGLAAGRIAVIGGPEVYSLFLRLGYDVFHLSRAVGVALPDGLPLFAPADGGVPEAAFAAHGLWPGPLAPLDSEVALQDWTPAAP